MIPLEGLNAQKAVSNLKIAQERADHVGIVFNAGQEIVMRNRDRKRSSNRSSSGGHEVALVEAPSVRHNGRVPEDEQIGVRAYELYLERGTEPNDRVGDWLRAENEYRSEHREDAMTCREPTCCG